MRDHAHEAHPQGGNQTKEEIELPEAGDLAAEPKSCNQEEATDPDNLFRAVTIQEMAHHGRDDGVNNQVYRKDTGSSSPAPTESVQQGDIKNPEGGVDAAGKTEGHKSRRGYKPGVGNGAHEIN